MTYDPAAVAAYFDDLSEGEWTRFEQTLGDRVSLARHTGVLERFIASGSRVLDVGAGPGRFTEVLHRLGCRVVVADISREQLELNRRGAATRGYAASVESWHQLDICDLSVFGDGSFDAVVAFGGPLSYVFDERDRALAECLRVLRGGGLLCLSVMSLWGSMHRFLPGVLDLPLDANLAIVSTGDLTPSVDPASRHHCHVFRSDELRSFLDRPDLELLELSASSAVATGHDASLCADPARWQALVEFEERACRDPGLLDAGTHLLAVVRRA
ncbi:MAG: class I SAM-dependent methyltransferase [Planctomycetes bacterium]|nr:class I SAM-dependent methyltransferase [Planctomycetota bacterium]